MDKYVLKDKIPVSEPDLMKWGQFMQSNNRFVKQENIVINGAEYFISTAFLGIEHGFDTKKPILFETMIKKNGKWLDYQTRCCDWEEAEEMHKKAIKFLENDN